MGKKLQDMLIFLKILDFFLPFPGTLGFRSIPIQFLLLIIYLRCFPIHISTVSLLYIPASSATYQRCFRYIFMGWDNVHDGGER